MTTNHKPATPLPWDHYEIDPTARDIERWRVGPKTHCIAKMSLSGHSNGGVRSEQSDAAYISHAANAYPRLVEALRDARRQLWDALGGNDDKDCADMANRYCAKYDAVLRELGEE